MDIIPDVQEKRLCGLAMAALAFIMTDIEKI